MGGIKLAVCHDLKIRDFRESPAHIVIYELLGMRISAVIDIFIVNDAAGGVGQGIGLSIHDPCL